MILKSAILPLFSLALICPFLASAETALKPNIIYILADDLGYGDLSFLGQKKFATPNIDRLAEKGMFFSEHYSGSSVCAPSRACFLSGKHSGRAYIRGNREIKPEGQEPMPSTIELLPEMLREAGYVSGAFGKWGLGFPDSEGDPLKQGFDEFYGYNCQRLGHHYYPYHLWDGAEKVMLEENAGTAKEVYAPNLIHNRTLAFIEKHKDQPFFCYVASIIPHADLAAPEEYMEKFRGKFPQGKKYKGLDKGPNLRQGPYQSQDEPRVAFAAMITLLDDQVGEIVAKTEELGIADNTLIIFTSDNGAHQEGGADPDFFDSNGIFRGHKRDLYEGGVHVPMVAYWPGKIAAGSESKLISAFWDMVPTLTELAGAAAPEDTDGISIVPTLLGEGEQEDHKYLYWEFHERGGRIAVRKGKWKAVKYNHSSNANSPVQLYDLSKDKSETKDVSADYPEIVQELVNYMKEAHTESVIFPFKAP
ncbi:MAG: arylsulfatase [Akkermansiaceae bacterium]|jgi:arylsulfatase A|nr:arylsulfatase [Akkermansiaceae bacterium]MDP4645854.1 arylsulfatase [Akkermansiaceae bacterium]MDP4720432.1 arylsulfatase [Akkermansiaceae bacterium]MDP4779174.1 arylsulfatase [Akkermansiaceae bacterium]MDP4848213.1 arylsulfatase [Akkermansiaceae bacterium]